MPPGTTPSRGPKRVRREASQEPLPRRGPAAGTKSPVLGRPPRAPRSRPVKPGARAPGIRKGTTASGADWSTQSDRTGRGAAHQRGAAATTKAHGQVPSNSSHRVPQTRAARTTRNEPRYRHRCQATHNPHTTNPSQEWWGTSGARTETHKPQHPSQEWRGAAKTQAEAHRPTPHTPARTGGVQAERAQNNAHPNTPARKGGAQPKPGPRHTQRECTIQPGVAWYKRSAHTSTHRPEYPSQEWQGAAETRAQAHTPTPHTPAGSGGVQAERAHQHTHTPEAFSAGLMSVRPQKIGKFFNPSPQPLQVLHEVYLKLRFHWSFVNGLGILAHPTGSVHGHNLASMDKEKVYETSNNVYTCNKYMYHL